MSIKYRKEVEKIDTEIIKNLTDIFTNNLTNNVPTIVFSIIVLVAGIILSKCAKKSSSKFLSRLNLDQVISGYISYAIYVICIFATLMIVLSMLGVPINTIMSLVVIVILGISIAFKTVLENIGAGFLMLIFKPFKTGDYVETIEVAGIVSDMHLFSTTLKTFDNKTIIVPNSKLTNQSITNYTRQEKRRVDIVLNFPYGTDMDKVKSILEDTFNGEPRTIKEQPFLIGIRSFKENGMEVIATAWVSTENYWDAFYSITYKIEKNLRKNDIDMNIAKKITYEKNTKKRNK